MIDAAKRKADADQVLTRDRRIRELEDAIKDVFDSDIVIGLDDPIAIDGWWC